MPVLPNTIRATTTPTLAIAVANKAMGAMTAPNGTKSPTMNGMSAVPYRPSRRKLASPIMPTTTIMTATMATTTTAPQLMTSQPVPTLAISLAGVEMTPPKTTKPITVMVTDEHGMV